MEQGVKGLPTTGLWVEKKTVDGVAYYVHPETGSVSWDKPDNLKSGEELEGGEDLRTSGFRSRSHAKTE